MNKKWFVGGKVSDFSQFNIEGPITGITLLVDDGVEYSAGDASGIVWEITNPYGTQQMANDILNTVKGKEYRGFHADNAVLDPSAELGDGVNVNGGFYMLGYKNVTFGPGHTAEISAPNNGELDHEYPYISKEEKEFNRKLAQTRSSITKTAEQIRLEVANGLDGLSTSFTVKLDGIETTIEDKENGLLTKIKQSADGILQEVSKTYATGESVKSQIKQSSDSILSTVSKTYATGESVDSKIEQSAGSILSKVSEKYATGERVSKIEQTASDITQTVSDLDGNFSQLQQTVEGFTYLGPDGKVMISNGSINLTGAITWDDFNKPAQDKVTNAQSTANSASSAASAAQSTANTANTAATNAKTAADNAKTAADKAADTIAKLAKGEYSGGTFIDGKTIYGPKIYTDELFVTRSTGSNSPGITFRADYSGRLLDAFALGFGSYDLPFVMFSSPAGCGASFDFSYFKFFHSESSEQPYMYFDANVAFQGNIDFQNVNLKANGDGKKADVVVDSGADSRWIWRKWASGVYELWRTSYAENANVTHAWGSLFTSNTNTFAAVDYPVTLPAIPQVFVTPDMSGSTGFWVVPYTAGTAARTPAFQMVRGSSASNVSGKLNIHVIGRWK